MKKIVLMVMLAMSILTSNAQSEYPTSKIEKHDVAILVIDMQNDFVDPKGKLCVAGAKATIPAINKLIAYGRSKNWKVVWITRDHRPSGVDVDAPRIPLFVDGKTGYCVPGTWGGALVDGLKPEKEDIMSPKYRNSAFFNIFICFFSLFVRNYKASILKCFNSFSYCIICYIRYSGLF